jgi:uncharacterized Zn finger protein
MATTIAHKTRTSRLTPEQLTALVKPFTREERIESNYEFAQKLLANSPDRIDPNRLEGAKALALDLVKFTAKVKEYETTIWRCRCPDFSFRHTRCKHMLAVMLEGCIFA